MADDKNNRFTRQQQKNNSHTDKKITRGNKTIHDYSHRG